MKTITIPKSFGYPTLDVTVNGKVYTVKSGEEITIEDHIAEAIENAIALAPKIGVPRNKVAQIADGSIKELFSEDLEGISTIRTYAFAFCTNFPSVVIPNSVKGIGSHAFYGCRELKSVVIGDGVTNIAPYICDWCTSLTKVYLPETPPTLENINAFGNINPACVFYCKTQESLETYKKAENWSTLTGTYTFVVEE